MARSMINLRSVIFGHHYYSRFYMDEMEIRVGKHKNASTYANICKSNKPLKEKRVNKTNLSIQQEGNKKKISKGKA